MINRTQLFIEGKNGGRTVKASGDGSWRCLDYGTALLPPITIGTDKGAVVIYIDEETNEVVIKKKRWKLSDVSPEAGVDALIYHGPIN